MTPKTPKDFFAYAKEHKAELERLKAQALYHFNKAPRDEYHFGAWEATLWSLDGLGYRHPINAGAEDHVDYVENLQPMTAAKFKERNRLRKNIFFERCWNACEAKKGQVTD